MPPTPQAGKENSSLGYKKEEHWGIKMVGSAKRKLKKWGIIQNENDNP